MDERERERERREPMFKEEEKQGKQGDKEGNIKYYSEIIWIL